MSILIDSYKEFSWLSKSTTEGKKCKIEAFNIIAKNKDDRVIGLDCRARDLYCVSDDYTVIWSADLLSQCNLKYITTIFNVTAENNLLYSLDSNFLTQIKPNKISKCNISYYETSENLLVSLDDLSLNLTKSDYDIESRINLMLSENDERSFFNNKLFKELNKKICLNKYLNLLNMERNKNDFYIILKDSNSKNIVIQNKYNVLFVPKCVEVNFIQINEFNTECFDKIEVNFTKNNASIVAYLQSDRVISFQRNKISCESNVVLKLKDFDSFIVRSKNKTSIIKNKNSINFWKENLHINEYNFPHIHTYLEEQDLITEFNKLNSKQTYLSNFNVDFKNENISHTGFNYNFFDFLTVISRILIIIGVIILIITFYRKMKKNINQNKQHQVKVEKTKINDIELDNLNLTIFQNT